MCSVLNQYALNMYIIENENNNNDTWITVVILQIRLALAKLLNGRCITLVWLNIHENPHLTFIWISWYIVCIWKYPNRNVCRTKYITKVINFIIIINKWGVVYFTHWLFHESRLRVFCMDKCWSAYHLKSSFLTLRTYINIICGNVNWAWILIHAKKCYVFTLTTGAIHVCVFFSQQ